MEIVINKSDHVSFIDTLFVIIHKLYLFNLIEETNLLMIIIFFYCHYQVLTINLCL